MRKFLSGVAVLIFAASSAFAADIPVKAAASPVTAVQNWTGCYMGLNGGGVWGRMSETWTPNPAGFPASGPVVAAAGAGAMNASGMTVGGQVGCNWQTNVAVWGVEADLNYTALSGARDAPALATGGVVAVHEEFQSRWLSTFRGRLGWAIDRTLLYVTGGLALASIRTLDVATFPASATTNTASGSTTRTGWTLGGGAEYAFAGAWSVKAEYLYVDLGSFSTASANSNPVFFPLATITHDHSLREHIVRLGLNYKFRS